MSVLEKMARRLAQDALERVQPGTSWMLNRITPEEGTVSDLYDKTDNEETEGQKRTIGYLVAAIVVGLIIFGVMMAGGGK